KYNVALNSSFIIANIIFSEKIQPWTCQPCPALILISSEANSLSSSSANRVFRPLPFDHYRHFRFSASCCYSYLNLFFLVQFICLLVPKASGDRRTIRNNRAPWAGTSG